MSARRRGIRGRLNPPHLLARLPGRWPPAGASAVPGRGEVFCHIDDLGCL